MAVHFAGGLQLGLLQGRILAHEHQEEPVAEGHEVQEDKHCDDAVGSGPGARGGRCMNTIITPTVLMQGIV